MASKVGGDSLKEHLRDLTLAMQFRNSGQTCVCANRFLVHSSVHEEFVSKLSVWLPWPSALGCRLTDFRRTPC